MKKALIVVLGLALASSFGMQAWAKATIEGKPVEYRAGGIILKGYLAWDENLKGKRPGILVVHEWWGQNEYVRHRARMLAELGYTALALDMYGEGKIADHPDDAAKFSSELTKNFPVAKERFLAALDYLKQQPTVDPDRIGAVGYCFGGGVVLNMARQGVDDLKAVASFHGTLGVVKMYKPEKITAAIRVYNGADDQFITPDQIDELKKEMADQKVDFKFVNYPGAVHSFTNPASTEAGKKFKLPLAYNANADKKSWEDMKEFFKKIFAK